MRVRFIGIGITNYNPSDILILKIELNLRRQIVIDETKYSNIILFQLHGRARMVILLFFFKFIPTHNIITKIEIDGGIVIIIKENIEIR